MFDFGDANDAQKKAISTVNGPVLITAGPGTGKTYTLVQRAIYLIEECKAKPEQIFIATFTEKAAKELITRITNELSARNIPVDVNEMYIGTFHSLCLRILQEHLEFTRFKRNYRLLDDFDQKYLIFQNIGKFRSIKDLDLSLSNGGAWRWADEISSYANNLTEELVDAVALSEDEDSRLAAIGNMILVYQELLHEENAIDFSGIQTECYKLLIENPLVLEELQNKILYLMIDEYQDTNYIQEQIVFMLGDRSQNICVVGDDDQGLYRFRGATIRNILEFPSKFTDRDCVIIPLVTNYRSNSDIVNFYNDWMSTTSGRGFKFSWDGYRYDKKIIPHETTNLNSHAVIKLAGKDSENDWCNRILAFINRLKASGKLTDYNQIAFLFNSVKHERVIGLANFLEKNGINVYSPRSDMFFKREEIQLTIGCLMLMFPQYVKGLEEGSYEFLPEEYYQYYINCVKRANKHVTKPENSDLLRFIRTRGTEHARLQGTTDYAYAGLLYQLFRFKPFNNLLDVDLGLGTVDLRPTRNLALFTQIISKFEYLHRISVFDGRLYKNKRQIDSDTELLFNQYLRLLRDGGITEYEDDAEYAPSGCVSFLTIHQSKGMEFPIVVVDSLGNVPRKSYKDLMVKIEEKYFHRPVFEPYDQMKYFDFWRLYYTAFSRAQNLLVLTCNEDKRTPSKYLAGIYEDLTSVDSDGFNANEFEFEEVKKVNLKNTFSFTSHISVYETCALQYKFYKELEFMPVRRNAIIFGTLVHETIEDIHKAVLRGEEYKVTEDNIQQWFNGNYISLAKSEHTYLAEPQREAALNQVLRYAERQSGRWNMIKQAEVDVTLVQPDYIIEGKIDLVKGEGDTVELVDFKSEHKPDMEFEQDQLEHYRRQLQLYAYLVEQRTGHQVSQMHLYYTAEENGNPMVSFPYTKTAIEGTVAAFDDTVHKILQKEFTHGANNPKTCANCDFRFYCTKQ